MVKNELLMQPPPLNDYLKKIVPYWIFFCTADDVCVCDDCDKAVDVRPEVHLHHIAVLQDGVRLYAINNTLTTKARREKGLGRTDGRTTTTEQALLPFSPAHLDGVLYFVFTRWYKD